MSKNIANILGLNLTKGDVGIEIEMEGDNLPRSQSKYFSVTDDSSLRGESAEYVLRRPIPIDNVEEALNNLWVTFDKNSSRLRPSIRTGVHCHINVQDLTVEQVMTFATCYYIVEEILIDFCGEDRVGNLFCLRAKDADFVIQQIIALGQTRNLRQLHTDSIRYAALNFNSLFRYGSLEFRALATPDTPDKIIQWAHVLYNIKQSSMKFSNPREVIAYSSSDGLTQLATTILGDSAKHFIKGDVSSKLFDGMRIAQDVAYACDWKSKTSNNIFEPQGDF